MIPKEVIDFISLKTETTEKDLIEKDLILHKILLVLSSDKNFRKNYAFKGGTCLTKSYFGYYRFSEDLDFSFINQKMFENISKKKIRRKISGELNKIIDIINNFCKENKLDFKGDKTNEKYFDFRGGNKFTTIKIYYNSSLDNVRGFIKLQFNFLEKMLFSVKDKYIESIVSKDIKKEFEVNFSENLQWIPKTLILKVYSLNEILSEKIRAILTRQGVKARDFIDIYKITSGKIEELNKIKKQIIEKTEFMLDYEKYYENLLSHKKSMPKYNKGEEKRLLIEDFDSYLEFYSFLEKLEDFLREVMEELNS